MSKTRDEYIASTKHQLDELNKKMDALEAKADQAKQDARDAYKAEMVKLRAQSKLAMDRFEKFKEAGDDAWDRSVAEMEKYRDAFAHSFNYFKSQV
jgi:ATP/maltotriose-dependent transcriptional regulator MalT